MEQEAARGPNQRVISDPHLQRRRDANPHLHRRTDHMRALLDEEEEEEEATRRPTRSTAEQRATPGNAIRDGAAPQLPTRRPQVQGRPQHECQQEQPRYLIYTDGAWSAPDEEGDDGVREAGHGVAEFEACEACHHAAFPMAQITRRRCLPDSDCQMADEENQTRPAARFARLVWAQADRVVTSAREKGHIGATAHTNNTGELTALHAALCRSLRRPRGTGREEIWTDSLYAMNMTTGKWKPKCKRNTEMIEQLRMLWRRLQRERPREVHIMHVRSHVKVPGNELADWLADLGRHGCGVGREEAERWLARWLARSGGGGGEREPG